MFLGNQKQQRSIKSYVIRKLPECIGYDRDISGWILNDFDLVTTEEGAKRWLGGTTSRVLQTLEFEVDPHYELQGIVWDFVRISIDALLSSMQWKPDGALTEDDVEILRTELRHIREW